MEELHQEKNRAAANPRYTRHGLGADRRSVDLAASPIAPALCKPRNTVRDGAVPLREALQSQLPRAHAASRRLSILAARLREPEDAVLRVPPLSQQSRGHGGRLAGFRRTFMSVAAEFVRA